MLWLRPEWAGSALVSAHISKVKVLVKGSQAFVTENNCVTVRWGGESHSYLY